MDLFHILVQKVKNKIIIIKNHGRGTMKKFRNQLINKLIFVGGLLVFVCIAQGQEYNDIDGVSSASKRFKINGGKAYSNYAEIVWNDNYSNGSIHVIKYGLTNSYKNSVNLKPFNKKTNITTKIENLLPDTTYYGQFYRKYGSKTIKTNFTFKTAKEATGISTEKSELQKKSDIIVYSIKNADEIQIKYFVSVSGRKSISLYNTRGVVIKKINVNYHGTGVKTEQLGIKRLSSGVYFIKIADNEKNVVFSQKINILR